MKIPSKLLQIPAALALAVSTPILSAGSPELPTWEGAEAILARIQAPTFPDRDFEVTAYGAKADGETDALPAIKAAIAACTEAGGGRVVLAGGEFYVDGPIHLESNVNLHVAEDATVLFSTDPKDYEPAVYTRWEGVECMNLSPLIYAHGKQNIAVTGGGILDGQASNESWWPSKGKTEYGWEPGMPHQEAARNRLFAQGEAGVPVAERVYGADDHLRPSFIEFVECENILIEDVRLRRAPMWQIHPVLSRNITVRGVEVVSHGPNNDGCNPESCEDVLIEDCIFDTGDDCIALKSGRNNDGRRVGVPIRNVVIRNCVMREGHGGVVLGSEISGGANHIYAENCQMSSPHLDRAIRIKTNSVRGGVIENLFFRKIEVGQVGDAVVKVNFLYEEGDAGEFTPIVRNIVIEDLTSQKSNYPLFIQGYERSPIENVVFRRCHFEGVRKPSVLRAVTGLQFDDFYQNAGVKVNLWGDPLPDESR
jgi:polygalacturonase